MRTMLIMNGESAIEGERAREITPCIDHAYQRTHRLSTKTPKVQKHLWLYTQTTPNRCVCVYKGSVQSVCTRNTSTNITLHAQAAPADPMPPRAHAVNFNLAAFTSHPTRHRAGGVLRMSVCMCVCVCHMHSCHHKPTPTPCHTSI